MPMSRVIRVSETTYRRLEQHVTGFGDNPDTVIERLLDYYEDDSDKENGNQRREGSGQNAPLELEPDHPGDLTHTKVLEGYFGEERVSNWKELMHTAHSIAYGTLGSFNKLREVTEANIEKGEHTESGFDPVLGAPISIQGANANNSWQNAFRLAKELKVPIEMTFRWRNKKKALHPGKKGKLSWAPNA